MPGVGRVFAAVFMAEIGDIRRFERAAQLASWAGMTPRHHESGTTIRRGRITKQGSRLVRWAAIEAASGPKGPRFLKAEYRRLAERRPKTVEPSACPAACLQLEAWPLRPCHPSKGSPIA
ncbi:MAG: transposase [Acidimicrobiales bacterium]